MTANLGVGQGLRRAQLESMGVCAVCPHCKWAHELTTEAGSDSKPDEIDEITAAKPDREFPLDCVWGCNFSACIYSICSGCDYCKEQNG
jgi:hypothetical protein